MTFLELLETMHFRLGTPLPTDLNVILPPAPLNIVSFA